MQMDSLTVVRKMQCSRRRIESVGCNQWQSLMALSLVSKLASYPGLLTPSFVTCITNAGKAW